jgi:hypothetical protein
VTFKKALESDHQHTLVIVGAQVLARKIPTICSDDTDKANDKGAD